MKSFKTILLASLAIALFAGFASDLNAQQFGKGRFFKKIREDIAAANKKQAENARKAAAKKANSKTPTVAPQYRNNNTNARTNSRQPSSKSRQTSNTSQTRQSSFARQQANAQQSANARMQANTRQQTNQRQPSNSRTRTPAIQASAQRTPQSSSNGFGWVLVEDRHNRLIVSKLAPKGNAAEEGVRPGDIIVEAGGVEITGKDEYESIIEIFRPGDQMDFTLESRGRDKEVTIQFGQAPPVEQLASTNQRSANNQGNSVLQNAAIQHQIQLLKGTIAEQQMTIQQLREEITRLRFESKSNSVIKSRSDDFGNDVPSFNGPSINAPRR